ncbi:MAG: hypothetical protein ACMUIP_07795 [bacterium]
MTAQEVAEKLSVEGKIVSEKKIRKTVEEIRKILREELKKREITP